MEKTMEHTFSIGGYANEHMAELDRKEFQDGSAFHHRSVTFPNPRSFGVRVEPGDVVVAQSGENNMAGFQLEVPVKVTGADEKLVQEWIDKVENMLLMTNPTAHKRSGDVR